MSKKLKSLMIEFPYDQSPDLSYLEQSYDDVRSPVTRNLYRKQDRERLDAYGRGDWNMMGVQAVAIVEVDTGADPEHGVHWISSHTFKSPGLWGVESDTERDYLKEVAEDELHQLADVLAEFGVELTTEQTNQALEAI